MKLQSAMEYLMTYGWSILIIAVVLGALFGLGIFNGAASLSSGCVAQPGYLCQQPVLSANGVLSVNIGQAGEQQINVTGVGCSNTASEPARFSRIGPIVLSSSQIAQGTPFNCPLIANTIGSSFTGTLWIQYTTASYPGITVPAQVGTVSVKVSVTGVTITGSSTLSSSSSSSSTSTISPFSASISPNSPSLDSGQTDTFTASEIGGTGPFTYSWSLPALVSMVSGCGSSDTTCTVLAGNVLISSLNDDLNVIVTDTSDDNNANAISTIGINPDPSVATEPGSLVLDGGQAGQFNAIPSGGTGTFSYTWSGNADILITGGCGSSDTTCSFDAVTMNSFQGAPVGLFITDTGTDRGATPIEVSPQVFSIVDVYPPLSVSISPNSVTLYGGQTETFNGMGSGGVGAYSYDWDFSSAPDLSIYSGCGSSDTTCTVLAASVLGQQSETLGFSTIDHPSGETVTANALVTIDPAPATPAVTLFSSASAVDGGQTFTLNAIVSGGVSPYTLTWRGSFEGPLSGCPTTAPSAGIYSCTVTAMNPGSETPDTYNVVATDADTNRGSGATTVALYPAPSVIVSPSEIAFDSGQTYTFTATPTGGTGSFQYGWILPNILSISSGCLAADPTCTVLAGSVATPDSIVVNMQLVDTGTPGASTAQATNFADVTVNPQLSVPTIDNSVPGQITINWNGGTQPYAVSFSYGSDPSTCSNDNTFGGGSSGFNGTSQAFTDIPGEYYCATVTDSGTPAEVESTPSPTLGT